MFFHSMKQALEHFNNCYDEDEFNCIIKFHEIFGKYSYVVEKINPSYEQQNKLINNNPSLPPPSSSYNQSITIKAPKKNETASKFGPFITDAAINKKNKPVKSTGESCPDDELLSDEAIRAVVASKARRKKPVPYAREHFSSTSTININQNDSERPRCIYCGDYNSGIVRDHVVSVAWRGGKRHYDRRHTVPSCPQCNNLLGDKPLHNIADRAAFLVDAIERHERRYLNTVDRTTEELAELDHFLAMTLKSAMYEKALALQRIEYAKQVSAGYYDYATIKHLVKQGREIPEE